MDSADVQDQLQRALGGTYAIERELGGGGMSRVFVADERALGRKVVVKVLRPELAEGLSAERFKREVRLAARLQHPHIVPLLAAGELGGGVLYYTMPFVDGESLRGRIEREGGLPVPDVVRIARDVASALAYAHRQGVVHRDIKPENILLADGGAVVADFGIAKAIRAALDASRDGSPRNDTASGGARRSSTLTAAGTSLGTPAYMAPEQAVGDVVDHRADLYALGVVAYEMLAGRPPFDGRTAQRLLAAHATEIPEQLARRRPNVPPALGALVMRLLEKNPADRPQSADEVLRALETAAAAGTTATTTSGADHLVAPAQGAFTPTSGATPSRTDGGVGDPPSASGSERRPLRSLPRALVAVAAAAAVAGAGVGAAVMGRSEALPQPLVAALTAPDRAILRPGGGFALSPDGTRLAFGASDAQGGVALWVRPLDDVTATRVEGTENGTGPFWSPDGTSLGFFAGGQLQVVDLRAGTRRSLCAAPRPGGGTWTTSGVIVYAPNSLGVPLFRVAAAGGPCTQLTRLRPNDSDHRRPSALPDGRHILFSSFRAKVALMVDVATGVITEVRSPGGDAQFAPPDWLLFRDEDRGVLYAQHLDMRTFRPVGEARVVLDPVPNGISVYAGYTASAHALVSTHTVSGRTIVWVNRQSAVSDSVIAPSGAYNLFGSLNIGLSHDARWVAFGGVGLWLHDRTRGVATRVQATGGGAVVGEPTWSPGDSLIAYGTLFGGPVMLRVYHVSTGTSDSLFSLGWRTARTPDWSPDSRRIAFQLSAGDSAALSEIWLYSFAERRATRLWGEPAGNLTAPRWSPDGGWLAYVSDETGTPEVYVRPVAGRGVGLRVSAAGGDRPRWRADGRELYYMAPDGAIMAVGVRLGADPTLSPPRLAVSGASFSRNTRGFEVTPDGERFVGLARADPPVFTLLMDWTARLTGR